MAQKAVRSEASSPNSLGPERDWPEVRGEECRPRTVLSWLLAKWVVGESEEAGRRTLSSHGPENPEEKEIALSLRRWNRNKTKQKILLPALHRGKERRCSRRLLRKSKLQHLRVAGGATLLREARRTGLCVDSAWGRSSSGGRRRAPTATGRLRPGPGGSGGWCITPRQDVLDRLGLLLYRRELLVEALDGVAKQPSLGDGGVEKACLVDVLHLCQVEPEMALLDHHGGHRLPEGLRRDFRRS